VKTSNVIPDDLREVAAAHGEVVVRWLLQPPDSPHGLFALCLAPVVAAVGECINRQSLEPLDSLSDLLALWSATRPTRDGSQTYAERCEASEEFRAALARFQAVFEEIRPALRGT